MEHSEDTAAGAQFFHLAISELAGLKRASPVRVLDFGCGAGGLVGHLRDLGYDAYGCDIVLSPEAAASSAGRLKQIEGEPYRIPFDDNWFDVVVSTTVLEHARNPDEYLPEIHRVLKVGGCAMHLFPGKWYLPSEPHMHVPLANCFYPRCPTWWFAIWALLGLRGPHQKGWGWRETVATYRNYYDTSVIYLSTREHERHALNVFGNCEWPGAFYITHAQGRFAQLCRKLPIRPLWGLVSREIRMAFLLQRKTAVPLAAPAVTP